jgi:hypothetical protein
LFQVETGNPVFDGEVDGEVDLQDEPRNPFQGKREGLPGGMTRKNTL